ncbi:hypothetical protein [Breoghania sp. L-A4]|uniref:hypothetical protein n=1 Tax=Breoghania sp. L-A4 TaxID=2304600 RepID=UPI000E35A3C1|nr:hypothetical protein [Breoghania sp. L-A4]AXS42314.1 hypothetical protein D1F64_22905 [Breoghania sp. L-A4]
MKAIFLMLGAVMTALVIHAAPAEAAKKKPTKAQIRAECAEAKKASDYDTPMGRAKAKIACLGHYSHRAYWKEFNRHNDCLRQTRMLCPD